jgi:uncharacterized membrane protein
MTVVVILMLVWLLVGIIASILKEEDLSKTCIIISQIFCAALLIILALKP